MEAGVARQGEFDGGTAEGPAGDPRVGILHGAVQQGARRLLGVGVRVVGAAQTPPHLGGGPAAGGAVGRGTVGGGTAAWGTVGECALQLSAHQRGLGLDVQPGEHEGDLVAEPAELAAAHLERGRRRFPADAADPHPVGAVVAQRQAVEPGGDVRARVARAGDLVEQLCGDRPRRDRAPGAGMLGDHARPVGVELGQWEARGAEVVLGEEGVVAAGRLRPALDHVSGHDRARERVVVVGGPAEVGGGRADHHGGVGDPSGDDDVRARPQALGDPERAEVGVGGQRVGKTQFVGAAGEVVPVDMGDRDVQPQPVGQLAQRVGEARRVQSARVGHHGDPRVDGRAEALLHLP